MPVARMTFWAFDMVATRPREETAPRVDPQVFDRALFKRRVVLRGLFSQPRQQLHATNAFEARVVMTGRDEPRPALPAVDQTKRASVSRKIRGGSEAGGPAANDKAIKHVRPMSKKLSVGKTRPSTSWLAVLASSCSDNDLFSVPGAQIPNVFGGGVRRLPRRCGSLGPVFIAIRSFLSPN